MDRQHLLIVNLITLTHCLQISNSIYFCNFTGGLNGLLSKFGLKFEGKDGAELQKILDEAGVGSLAELYGNSACSVSGFISMIVVTLAARFML